MTHVALNLCIGIDTLRDWPALARPGPPWPAPAARGTVREPARRTGPHAGVHSPHLLRGRDPARRPPHRRQPLHLHRTR